MAITTIDNSIRIEQCCDKQLIFERNHWILEWGIKRLKLCDIGLIKWNLDQRSLTIIAIIIIEWFN